MEKRKSKLAALRIHLKEGAAQQIQDDEHARYWHERAEDQARDKNMQKSGGIPHDDMMNWVEDLV